jgi:hypothetical protein
MPVCPAGPEEIHVGVWDGGSEFRDFALPPWVPPVIWEEGFDAMAEYDEGDQEKKRTTYEMDHPSELEVDEGDTFTGHGDHKEYKR